ncbi:UvrD-helicase domain-containing protein [Vibrio ulleungensis]|uniref:DNA 3'-5' helicase n=1 Tax=Vibrio ulleungensis TaxID=2807619 RepID=A0ABS2HCM3_9VIBR|nr:UvrD-helicase domain-containing protein [Vibrio ulleungensis]MBM7035340.1 UvrD-helicase domain-containing protein [Vibrio ulleungensis]
MTKWTLTTNFLARFFKSNHYLVISELGIEVESSTGKSLFKWEQIESPPSLGVSLTGSYLAFKIGGDHHHYSMLGFTDSFKRKHQLFPLWANKNAGRLDAFLSAIEIQCTTRYLRDSSIVRITDFVSKEFKRWHGWEEANGLSTKARETAETLCSINRWDQPELKRIRDEYISVQLEKYQMYFDNVESNPLTDKQRIACVTDNDNNLLLAGAGTGKTSVMVGRTGYLLKSRQAKPDDILLLAYGRIAALEMDERIKSKLHVENVKASTFHSLGMQIITEVEGTAPQLSPLEGDLKAKTQWMNNEIANLMHKRRYRKALLDYFSSYYFVEKDPFKFKSQGEYIKYLHDNDIRTLKGEQVKSFGEMVVANWLYRKGINYEYEAKYRIDVATHEYRQYEPDFYLPEYDIYIEHYGIDENGNAPPYIDSEKYRSGIEWKRNTHRKYGTGYVEVFYHQHRKGVMELALEEELQIRQVNAAQQSDDIVLNELEQMGQVIELARLFGSLVDMYKAAHLNDAGVKNVIKYSSDPKQTSKALELVMPLYQRYQEYLAEHGYIDFNDMISKSLDYVQSGKFKSPWKYILVDEFQDISEPRARLVKALRDNAENSSLFCVGDDWQAIYRFSGADVRLTTDFEQYFGTTSKTTLDKTFRFNSAIGSVATKFVTQNPVQLRKEISSLVELIHPAISIIRQGDEEQGISSLDKALTSISNLVAASKKTSENKVYLLSRYWHKLPDANYLKWLRQRYPTLNLENLSFHASKGKEADYVVILGLGSGKHGFPSEKQIPPLIEALLPQGDEFKHAEERRLFYVAITRARHKAYLLVDMTDPSDFILELMNNSYLVEVDEFDVSLVQLEAEKIICGSCKVGTLQPRSGKYGRFMSCSLFPRCKNKETQCDKCGSPMSRSIKEGFQVCIDSNCAYERPVCQNCGSEMKLRHGKYGAFWGCSTYRRNVEDNCSFKISC